MTAPLPLPDDRRFQMLIDAWNYYPEQFGLVALGQFPRSAWLHDFEAILREHYPDASSKRLTLTARLAAPFPLARPGVP